MGPPWLLEISHKKRWEILSARPLRRTARLGMIEKRTERKIIKMDMTQDWRTRYTALVEFLGKALGPDYEVVCHDLTGNTHRVLAIANQQVSGRSADAPLSSLALSFIREREYLDSDYRLSYKGISASGERLRCSTMFIKGDQGELLGMLCINFNSSKYEAFARAVSGFVEANYGMELAAGEGDTVENFSVSIGQTYETVTFKIFGEGGVPSRLSQRQKTEIVRRLDECGVFLIKGAVPEVAQLMGSSVASVYRYLSDVRRAE